MYEWYNLDIQDLRSPLLHHFNASLQKCSTDSGQRRILQIGVGNSLILEELIEDALFPIAVKTTNIDISDTAIEFMNARTKKKEKIEYVCMDACDMDFEDESFEIVFDKGTVDALLSHGEDEYGNNKRIKKLMKEVFRVLKENGSFILISGNERFILDPYLFVHDWSIEVYPIERTKQKKNFAEFAQLKMSLLVMTKDSSKN